MSEILILQNYKKLQYGVVKIQSFFSKKILKKWVKYKYSIIKYYNIDKYEKNI